MTRWIKRIAAGIGLLALVAAFSAAGIVLWFARSVPSYEGTVEVTGSSAPVRILRDSHAVPHIVAESFADAAFGLGYVHAQDRLWQMELSRRFIQGRVAEMFGEAALGADIQARRLGIYAAAEAAVSHLSPEARQVLESYAAGVNAFLDTRERPLPIEFTLAGIAPQRWRPADSVAVIKGMAMQLSGNAGGEAARIRLLSVLGRTGVEDFLGPYGDGPLPEYVDTLFGTTRFGEAWGIPDISASNNWAVDGAHSTNGKPLLANDPHLGFNIPSIWYLAHLSIPGEDMVGGTLAGVPAIVAGRNRHLGWGMTNTGPDTQDLYLERLNEDNPNEYQTPAGWAEFEARSETIDVRFGGAQTIVVRSTRHGPVVDADPAGQYEDVSPPGYVLALSWTALAPNDTTIEAILALNRAADAEVARAAGRLLVAPMQNIVYADDSGHIGLMLPGRVPLRTELNDSLGLVPAPGWDPRYDWQGYIPPEEAPHAANPSSGRIVTANNKTVPDDYPYVLGRDWEPPYRHDRIDALLAATSAHDVESFRAIQLDTVDTYATALKARLIAAGPFPGTTETAADLIAGWDGSMLRERPEPLIFAAWARALAPRLYADELGASFFRYWGYREDFTLRVLDGADGQERWCDVRGTPERESCASRIRLALDDAVAELSAAYGPNPNAWRWGDAHISVHQARPFGAIPVIGGWFNREIEMDGGPFTVLRADHRMGSNRPYAAVHGAGYRGIYDFADAGRSLYIISTGQSGNLYSPYYDDLLPIWAAGGYITIPTDPGAIAAETAYRLVLTP